MGIQLEAPVVLKASHHEAIATVTAALKEAGFGVLTRIDLHQAFRDKLGVEHPPHTILGACNPPLAHKAISADPLVGLMLPCNVTVEETAEGAVVRVVDPEAMLGSGLDAGPTIREVAHDAAVRLRGVLSARRG
ncbi:MAG: DUF302 domain-containing protein [Gemmatimonadota bacterium]